MDEREMHVCSGRANRPLAQAVARELGRELLSVSITQFVDGEVHVLIDELVRHQDIYIIQPCSAPVNDHLMELLLMIDAFRRASAHAINVVMPYFPYARQDRMARGREAISAKVVARMIQQMGATRVVYVDIHAQATQGFFDIPVDPLTALSVLAEYFRGDAFANAAIVSPERRTEEGAVQVMNVAGDIGGRTPIVIDDVIAAGSVLTQLPALIEAGAKAPVYLAITHPVLLPTAVEWLDSDLIAELVVTDTIHVPQEHRHPKLRILSVAPLLAQAIRRIHGGESIGPLVEGTWQKG
jgi:ribose-phosphate pyrophosphokinase